MARYVLAILLLVGIGAYGDQQIGEPVSCQEDDPCWDCPTMGDGVCGVPDGGYGSYPGVITIP